MVAINPAWPRNREEWIAELTLRAYHSVLDRGFRGSFLDLELSLWHAIRQAVDSVTPEVSALRPIDFAQDKNGAVAQQGATRTLEPQIFPH